MSKLFCVCNKAEKKVCEVCPKYKQIKPDNCFNISTWKRNIKPEPLLFFKNV